MGVVEARTAVNGAMIAIEQRLAANPTSEEQSMLRAGYSRLWIILGQLDEAMLSQAAAQVQAAARRLEEVVATAIAAPLPSYLGALRDVLTSIGVQTSAGTGAPATPSSPHQREAASDVSGANSASNSWKDLVDFYRAYPGTSKALKIATLSQWIVESGRGSSPLATRYNNFGGIKFRERMAGHAVPVDYTGSDGETTTYCQFDSLDKFVAGYWHFIVSGPYEGWENYREDGPGFIRHIAPKYAADPAYTSKVLAVFGEAGHLLSLAQAPDDPGVDQVASTPARVAVVVGHNRLSKGAYAGNPINQMEFDFNSIVAQEMQEQAGHYNLQVQIFHREPSGDYSVEIRDAYSRVAGFDPVCALELHFNGLNDPAANGIEMLCRSNNRAQSLGLKLVSSTKNLLNLSVRHGNGLKVLGPGDRGWASVSALPNVPSILAEPFFGSNALDCVSAATAGKQALGRAYLRAVRDWLEAEALTA
ncbi:MAG: glucosaminidase domain-containing protein [Allorhizobium sp.]